jgi:hypothetical protein
MKHSQPDELTPNIDDHRASLCLNKTNWKDTPTSDSNGIPARDQIDSLICNPTTSGRQLALLVRALLYRGDFAMARRVMDAAIDRGGDEVARLATFTERDEGVAYGRMRLILGRTPTVKCLALCDLGILKLMKGDVTGARNLFRRAVGAESTNREAMMWFHLLERWGEHLSQFFLSDRPLPTLAAASLNGLLPDASNGYQSQIRRLSRLSEPTSIAA